MEQGPVLILTFSAQQTMCAIDARGNVIEGGEVGDLDCVLFSNFPQVLCFF